MSVNLRIVTPSAVAFEGTGSSVTGPGFYGEFGVLSKHAKFLTLNAPGVVRLKGAQTEGSNEFVIGKGFAEVSDDCVTYLVDSCTPVTEIDGDIKEFISNLNS